MTETQAEIAERIARFAHAGQFRRDGVTPYIVHPQAVAASMTSDLFRAVAWLHDVAEDTPFTYGMMARFGIVPRVIRACRLLDKHRTDASYLEFITALRDDPIARVVKIADIQNNLSGDPTPQQVKKYRKALVILGAP